jgi:hypothetical protein
MLTASILAAAGAARSVKTPDSASAARNLAGNQIEDSTTTRAVGAEATGSRVRAQILLDRARFSPGEIDGVYGDDFGIAVKGFRKTMV